MDVGFSRYILLLGKSIYFINICQIVGIVNLRKTVSTCMMGQYWKSLLSALHGNAVLYHEEKTLERGVNKKTTLVHSHS